MSIHYIKVVHGFPSRQIHGLERERGQRPTDPKCMFKIIKSGHICLQLILILHLTPTKSFNGSITVIFEIILACETSLQEEYRKQLAGNMMNKKNSRILAYWAREAGVPPMSEQLSSKPFSSFFAESNLFFLCSFWIPKILRYIYVYVCCIWVNLLHMWQCGSETMLCSHEQEVCEQLKWSLSGAMMNVCVMYECVCMYIYVCLYVGRYACIYAAGKGSMNMCVCVCVCVYFICVSYIEATTLPYHHPKPKHDEIVSINVHTLVSDKHTCRSAPPSPHMMPWVSADWTHPPISRLCYTSVVGRVFVSIRTATEWIKMSLPIALYTPQIQIWLRILVCMMPLAEGMWRVCESQLSTYMCFLIS